nr:restriction endonuclease subunit S [uncultured Flavobacterium sp.]
MKEQQEKYILPEGWIWTTIGEIAILSSGGTPNRGNRSYFNGDIPWVKSGELNHSIIAKAEESITQEAIENSSAKIVPSGTLLIALYGSTVGKLAFLGIDAATNQAVAALKTTNSFESKYLYYYLLHNRERLLQKRVGGAQPNISQKILQIFPIPLSPLQEQEIIVHQIESLFSKLDEAEKGLNKADRQLIIYRQVLLKNAFNGEITKKTRINSSLSSLTPKEIIEEDLIARKKYWIEKKAIDLKKQNKNFKIENLEKKYSNPLSIKNPTLIIPREWEVTNWDHICNWITYGFTKKILHVDKGLPIVTGKNVINNKVDFSNVHSVSEGEYSSLSEKDLPKIGDILITKDGTLGRVALVDRDNFCISQSVAVIWLRSTIMNKNFLLYYLQTPYVQSWIKANAKGSTIKHLSISDLPKLEVPVPPLNEQNEIVGILESQNTLLDNLSRFIRNALNDIIALKHSILKNAFEGKLVNYTSNESVESLLNDIQKEKKLYLENQKELSGTKPKKKKQMEEKKSILEILKESNLPISAQELWEKSTSEGDIERFYSEIKEIYSQIDELKSNTESLLTLKDENK